MRFLSLVFFNERLRRLPPTRFLWRPNRFGFLPLDLFLLLCVADIVVAFINGTNCDNGSGANPPPPDKMLLLPLPI